MSGQTGHTSGRRVDGSTRRPVVRTADARLKRDARHLWNMDVTNVTADAETFTCNAYLAPEGSPTLVDAGSVDGVVDVFDPDVYADDDHPLRTHEITDGDVVTVGTEECEVVYTPGHADDHVSFVSAASLFSGDVVVHDDGAFDYGSFGRTDYPGQSRERLIESIRTLLERMPDGVEGMYSGHGSVFHGDVRDVVETALSRAEQREPKYPDG